jgi:hypothetical protein
LDRRAVAPEPFCTVALRRKKIAMSLPGLEIQAIGNHFTDCDCSFVMHNKKNANHLLGETHTLCIHVPALHPASMCKNKVNHSFSVSI